MTVCAVVGYLSLLISLWLQWLFSNWKARLSPSKKNKQNLCYQSQVTRSFFNRWSVTANIYVSESYREGEAKGKREIFRPLVHYPSQARPKLGARTFIPDSCIGTGGPRSLSHRLGFPSLSAGSWTGSGAAGTQMGTYTRGPPHRQQLYALCHNDSPSHFPIS